MAAGFGCCSIALRGSFLAVALPLLLVGSLFSQIALQLQLESAKHLKYAAAEGVMSTGLEASAQITAAGAVEEQTEALELSAQAAALQSATAEEEQGLIATRAENAGLQTGGQGAMNEASVTLQTAVESAANEAAHRDSAIKAAVEAATGDVFSDGAEAAAAGEVAGVEGGVAEGATAAGVESGAEAVGGPMGLAIATAGLAAAQQAPQAVAAAQGVATEFQADRDEVLVVEKEAQAGGLEADTMIEMEGAATAQAAATKSMAAAAAYFTSAQIFQMLAFALEAPVALVVIAQWTLGAGVTVLGAKQCDSSVSAFGAAAGTISLTAALGSLLLAPWAKTVLYAADLENGDEELRLLSSLPHLIKNATKNMKGHKKRESPDSHRSEHEERKLQDALAWVSQATKAAQGLEGNVAQGVSQMGNVTSQVVQRVEKESQPAMGTLSKEMQGVEKEGGRAVGDFTKDVQKGTSEVVKNVEKQGGQAVQNMEKQGGQMVQNAEKQGGQVVQNVEKQGGQVMQNVEKASQPTVDAAEAAVSKEASQLNKQTSEVVHNIDKSVPVGVKQQVVGAASVFTNATSQAVHGAEQVGGSAIVATTGAIDKVVPNQVKTDAEEVAKNTKHVTDLAAIQAKQAAMRLKNGNPDIHTTTVAPQEPGKSPALRDALSQLQPALVSVWHSVLHWTWPVFHNVLLLSVIFALTELFIATGRHLPSYQKGCVNSTFLLFRVVRDIIEQWMTGIALLVAAWVLSIILAPVLQSTAQSLQDQLDSGGAMVTAVQMGLCTTCFLACCGRASCMARDECRCDVCHGRDGKASREEMEPIAKATESDLEVARKSSPPMSEAASASICCMVITAGIDAGFLAMERPVTAWAMGNSYRSFLAARFVIGLLPWSMMAPTIWFYTPSSPYELMIPVAFVAFLMGGLLHFAKQKALVDPNVTQLATDLNVTQPRNPLR